MTIVAALLLVLAPFCHAFLIPSRKNNNVVKVSQEFWTRRTRRGGGTPRFDASSSLEDPTTTTTTTTSSSTSTAAPPLFDWAKEWYPVAPVKDLSTTSPNKVTILGKDFCVWYDDGQSQWTAFADSCPHRLVPLSEGRLEGGVLQCAYHGWEFESTTGSCVRIPQLSSTQPIPSTAACATRFPVQIAQELLWIFPTSCSDTMAALKCPALIPQLNDPNKVDATAMYCRDLPYSWHVLVENLCDPAHVVYAHHSYMRGADRYSDDKNKQVNLKVVSLSQKGFTAERQPIPTNGKYQVRFEPPCLLYYDIANSRAMGQSLNEEQKAQTYVGLGSYCIPTGPNTSRLIARFPFYLPVPAVMAAMKYTPRWITHYTQNIVLDSDVVFLSTQDETLQHFEHAQQRPNYYLPARSDAMVVAFRKWLQMYGSPAWLGIPAARSGSTGGSSMSWIRVPPPRHGREALLDRYRQHTQICSSCRVAHERLHRLSGILRVVSFGALVVTALLPRRRPWQVVAASAMTSAAAFLIPHAVLQPLLVRLECVPWPRRQWVESPKRKELHV